MDIGTTLPSAATGLVSQAVLAQIQAMQQLQQQLAAIAAAVQGGNGVTPAGKPGLGQFVDLYA